MKGGILRDLVICGAVLTCSDALAQPEWGRAIPPTDPSVVTIPTVRQEPSPEAIRASYPTLALKHGVAGTVRLRCGIIVEGPLGGALTNCSLVRESPTGYGFAERALRLAYLYKAYPGTIDGVPQPTPIEIAIDFKP